MDGNSTIRCAIKEYRQRKGFSQEELASLIGVRRQAVYDMESGRYLPNTGVALKLARVLGCSVEALFIEEITSETGEVHLLNGQPASTGRLALARVRERLVGIPLQGAECMPFRLHAADGLLLADQKVELLLPQRQLAKTVLMLGCDPALSVLSGLLSRSASDMRSHSVFASSGQALRSLALGNAHVAAIHFHSSGASEANVDAARALFPAMNCFILAFSLQEEGLMVKAGNPLAIRTVEDLADAKARFVNREEGAALRKLMDAHMERYGLPSSAVRGYETEVSSHCEGALQIAGGMADAALGLRIVAESFGIGFVPLATTRCDLVIPADFEDHPGIAMLLNTMQSADIKKELNALPGYDASLTGKIIFKAV